VPTTNPAGAHGGNMDIVETAPGSHGLLPVFVPARLPLPRRAMRPGPRELSATGLEMPSESEITVDLLRTKSLPGRD